MKLAIAALAAAGLVLGACERPMPLTVSKTPRLDTPALERDVGAVAARSSPGVLGVGVMNLESGESWGFNGERPFPMAGVFEAVLAAAVLSEVDAGRLSLDENLDIADHDLSPPPSGVADAWPGKRSYTVRDLLQAAVVNGDNTAADVLMKRIGGPGAVQAWLQAKRIDGIRVDRYQRQLAPEIMGAASFRPEWAGKAWGQALAAVPPERRAAALRSYLGDQRDTATPRGMLNFLDKLDGRELVSPASTTLLLDLLSRPGAAAGALRAGFPSDATLAHKVGIGPSDQGLNAATNDVGLVGFKDGRRYAVAVFLAGDARDERGRGQAIAEVARAVRKAAS